MKFYHTWLKSLYLLNESLYAIKSLLKSSFDKDVDNETGI
jgi:hypothetical protein